MKKLFIFVTTLLLVQAAPVFAQFEEGFEYKRLPQPMPTADKNKVEVIEFFWYGCPHCYHFEPSINKWLASKPDNVNFIRMPAVFRENFVPHARAFYTAEYLKMTDKLHKAIFEAYHEKKQKLQSKTAISELFMQNGVSQEDFDKAWHSFVVQSKLKRAINMTGRYKISSVPTMVINGKYQTHASMANVRNPDKSGHDMTIQVTNWLIAREAADMKKAAK